MWYQNYTTVLNWKRDKTNRVIIVFEKNDFFKNTFMNMDVIQVFDNLQ